jgi:hypothetical protein
VFAAFQAFQSAILKFRDARQGSDVFSVRGDSLADRFHLSVVPLEDFIVILLADSHFILYFGDLTQVAAHFLEVIRHYLKDALDWVQPVIPVDHRWGLLPSG